jgi:hypothetical protein
VGSPVVVVGKGQGHTEEVAADNHLDRIEEVAVDNHLDRIEEVAVDNHLDRIEEVAVDNHLDRRVAVGSLRVVGIVGYSDFREN